MGRIEADVALERWLFGFRPCSGQGQFTLSNPNNIDRNKYRIDGHVTYRSQLKLIRVNGQTSDRRGRNLDNQLSNAISAQILSIEPQD